MLRFVLVLFSFFIAIVCGETLSPTRYGTRLSAYTFTRNVYVTEEEMKSASPMVFCYFKECNCTHTWNSRGHELMDDLRIPSMKSREATPTYKRSKNKKFSIIFR